MDEADWLAARFDEQRAQLRAVAYRMLGSFAEADDAVQNAWLRLNRADAADIENLGGWLTTVVSRECLNLLRARRSRREEELPEVAVERPVAGQEAGDPEAEVLLADSVGPALMMVLDALAPAERLAFVLHDIFAMPFDEIAAIVERSPAATRQLASRARRRVHGASPPQHADLARQRQVTDAFLAALRQGDFDALFAVLDPDVVLTGDSAVVMQGARAVAEYALTFSDDARFVRAALVGGVPGLAIGHERALIGALGFGYSRDKISSIEMISDPDRLQLVVERSARSSS